MKSALAYVYEVARRIAFGQLRDDWSETRIKPALSGRGAQNGTSGERAHHGPLYRRSNELAKYTLASLCDGKPFCGGDRAHCQGAVHNYSKIGVDPFPVYVQQNIAGMIDVALADMGIVDLGITGSCRRRRCRA